ncbi:MAG: FAD-dependent thymidylate synthase [Parachlamydiales bacterium]|nr:FAD-dependent thymidylate synthase [Parachlamydiales bacterium]
MENYEGFSETQMQILEKYVTNTKSNVFVLRNLPEVIKGALFSKYSRSVLGLRALLLKEFILNEEAAFQSIVNTSEPTDNDEQVVAIQKAQSFYDRILDGYGDDSIGELGGAHLAVENLTMIGAKIIEDCRIGGSPLEKSTRYVYFDQKVDGEYLYYREPILMTSAYKDLYINTCNQLFETYSRLIPPLTALLEEKYPKQEDISKGAYTAALRAKVLDCLRGLLPTSTLTNMGVFGNGRFFEQLIHKMHCHNLAEMKDVGAQSFEELAKVMPSFIKRSEVDHRHHLAYCRFYETMESELKMLAVHHNQHDQVPAESGVKLIKSDPESVRQVAAALLFAVSNRSFEDWLEHCKHLPEEEINRILDAACSARENRRQKSPRGLEHATFTFEIVADFGIYRDLQRHRILTQDRQMLSCDHGFWISNEIIGTPMEKDYCSALDNAKEAFDIIAKELPEEAQYIVPMAYNIRWYFHVNLRALQWICELRSAPAGHPGYRFIAQEMAKKVCEAIPAYERFFKFVDYDGHDLGRLGQEQRRVEKKSS